MDEPLTYNDGEIPVAGYSKNTRFVERISLQTIRTVIPLAVVYYVIPFLVDGYIYETRLKGFADQIRTLRDFIEKRIDEDKPQGFQTRLEEATQYFDRALRRVEDNYSEESSVSAESRLVDTTPQPVSILQISPTSTQIPEQKAVTRPTLLRLENVDGEDLVWNAKRWIGTPYFWGGTRMWDGTDCSGFTQGLYRSFGVDLPRTARQQFDKGLYIPRKYLQPGDLVFFTTIRPGASHVGMYAGDGKFIHASSGTGWVTINNLNEPYFAKRYLGARRIINYGSTS